MPALTTARTTAFMPALSPPEVRTASFILCFVCSSFGMVEMWWWWWWWW